MAVNAILLNEQLLLAIEGSASIPPIRSSGLRLRLNYATDFWPNSPISAPPMTPHSGRRNLRAKNDLTAADAQRVEEAFRARLATLPAGAGEPVQQTPTKEAPCGPYPGEADNRPHSKVIDKSLLALPEPRRVRDRDHVKSVAKQPCLICGRQPADAHHVRFAQHRALGRKVSDEFTVPLCRGHHRELHRCGDEAEWWKKIGIDPTVYARTLWPASHPHPG